MMRRPRATKVAPANFSQDLRPRAQALAAAAVAFAATALVLAALWLYQSAELERQAQANTQRAERLSNDIAAARSAAVDAPAMQVFAALRGRIDALNALDHGDTAAVGGLLDALESVVPNDASLTTIDFDRGKGSADVVAVSVNSVALTHLFDSLDGHALVSGVRLLDKKQMATGGVAQTQVSLVLDVGKRKPPPAAASARGGGAP